MVLGVGHLGFLADVAQDGVSRIIRPHGSAVMRHVRDAQQQILLLLGGGTRHLVESLDAVTHLTHALLESLGLLAAAFLHHLPDKLGGTVPLTGELLLLRLCTPALLITLQHLIHQKPMIAPAQADAFFHILRFLPDNTYI